jgi:hypothetical protein
LGISRHLVLNPKSQIGKIHNCPSYRRESIPMQGGTTFHFATAGIHHALERATAAANGKDVWLSIQNRKSKIAQAICPVLLGSGERFLGDIDLVRLGYT